MKVIAAVLAMAAFAVAAAPPPLALARRGAAPAYAIMVRAGASACERYAAEELRDFLNRQTGVSLPIVSDEAPLPSHAILLGDTRHTAALLGGGASVAALGDEGFRLKAAAPHLLVWGGAGRGPLYGVYELLERFGGCAWYSLRFQVVPRLDEFAVSADLDETQRPAFELRSENWNGRDARGLAFAARNKLNLEAFDERLGGSRFRFDPVLGKCHTFNRLLPPERWFDAHPEYFSLVGGHRLRVRTQLCLTNPDVLRICTEQVMARIAESYPKGIRYYGVSPNDWLNACECPNCAAVDRAAKSRAGTLIAFVNKIAEAVEKVYPDVFIQTLAYSYTRHPPVGVVPRRNVQVCLCTIACDFSKPIPESRAIENRRVRHEFDAWGRSGCALSVWDYASNFGCYHHLWPNYGALRGNLAFFREKGASQVFTLVNGGGPNEVWSNIRCWLLAKWMWNPGLDERTLIDRCFRDHFGPAAPLVHDYFDLLKSAPRDTKRFPLGCFANIYAAGLDDALLVRAAERFARAEEVACGTPFEENVRLARIPTDFTRAIRGAARPSLARRAPDAARWREERDAARRLVAVMDRPGGLALCDDRAGRAVFATRLRALAAQEAPPGVPVRRLTLEETHLTGNYPATEFEYVDDPAAQDGRAIRFPGASGSCTAWLDFRSLDLDAGGVYIPRVRVRTSACATNALPFRMGVYNRLRGRVVAYFTPDAAERAHGCEAYRWYGLGAVSPQPGDALWIGLGGGDDPNTPAPDVWLDRVELLRPR
ncbi:MAG: DUF4838 domain-containing protein [Kiritimatiellia bacterium]